MTIADLISGIIKGIGGLIGEIRKSREAILLLRYLASIAATFFVVTSASFGLGQPWTEALRIGALAAATVAVASPLALRLDIRLPEPIASAISQRIRIADWELEKGPAPVAAQEGGIYLFDSTTISLTVSPSAPIVLDSLLVSARAVSKGSRLRIGVNLDKGIPQEIPMPHLPTSQETTPRALPLRIRLSPQNSLRLQLAAEGGLVHLVLIQTNPPLIPEKSARFLVPQDTPRAVFSPPELDGKRS